MGAFHRDTRFRRPSNFCPNAGRSFLLEGVFTDLPGILPSSGAMAPSMGYEIVQAGVLCRVPGCPWYHYGIRDAEHAVAAWLLHRRHAHSSPEP
jgi:hypothetical protein